MLEKIWRYTVNSGEFGGIVIADTVEEATRKVAQKYTDKEDFQVWSFKNDEYFDENNQDVIECYGI